MHDFEDEDHHRVVVAEVCVKHEALVRGDRHLVGLVSQPRVVLER